MSRKSAANFSIGGGAQQYHHYTIPKSRSEIFVEYMKSTGYELPRHFSPSHCDFLFQDTELFDCTKFLMGRAKRSVNEDSLKKLEKLLDNKDPLSKSELHLEETEENEVLLQISQSRKAVAEEMEALNEEINQTRSRISQWSQIKSLHRHALELKETEAASERYQNESWQRKAQCINHEFQDKRVLLANEIRPLRAVFSGAHIGGSAGSSSEGFKSPILGNLFQNKFDCIDIKKEDSFFSLLRSAAENYGTGFVGKSEVFNPFENEEFARECAANVTDVERLRALILHEFEKNFRLKSKIQKYAYVNSRFSTLVDTAKRIASQSPEIQTRIICDIQNRTGKLNEKVEALKQLKRFELRKAKLSELNGQIQEVRDLKAVAKIKENHFFGFISSMLLNQRARLEIGMLLMKRRNMKLVESMELITTFQHQLQQFQKFHAALSPGSMGRQLSSWNPELQSALAKYNIPTTVLSSVETSCQALFAIDQNDDVENIRKTTSDQQKVASQMRHIDEAMKNGVKNWQVLKSSFSDDPRNDQITSQLQLKSQNRAIKSELSLYPGNRDRLTKEAIDWKRSKIGDINSFLENLPKFM